MSEFDYLVDKIVAAQFELRPFKHLKINHFFKTNHLEQILSAPEITLVGQPSDQKLVSTLFDFGYKIIDFPGCITNPSIYLNWHKTKKGRLHYTNTSCEGFGMAFRLAGPQTPFIKSLITFFHSDSFKKAASQKFSIPTENVFEDIGIQKYLDGYEISPHPDVRKKALTFMININSNPESESLVHHTHYLTLLERYKYVQVFWEGNPGAERCWVPWDWCQTQKVQNQNNSLVMFAPNNDTLHAIKAEYDHLQHQRTQIYGNLWFRTTTVTSQVAWEDLVVGERPSQTKEGPSLLDRMLLYKDRMKFRDRIIPNAGRS